ncbi:MAG: hypothetical protein LBH08_00385 [Puniceicoccales bacterium]|nr:hypothetical protein [Puniceicoccales bacterium]
MDESKNLEHEYMRHIKNFFRQFPRKHAEEILNYYNINVSTLQSMLLHKLFDLTRTLKGGIGLLNTFTQEVKKSGLSNVHHLISTHDLVLVKK